MCREAEKGDKRMLWVEGAFSSNVTILNYKLKSRIKNHKTIIRSINAKQWRSQQAGKREKEMDD